MKKYLMILTVLSISMLSGCEKKAVQEAPLPEEYEAEEYYEDDFPEDEEYEEHYDYEEYEAEYPEEEEMPDEKAQDKSDVIGEWYTDGYDEESNWAMSYKIELSDDGKASCVGWRNKDTGTYEITGNNKVLITFDHCETDEVGEGFKTVDGFRYTVEMSINGNDAQIKIDAPDVISNLEDGTVHRKSGSGKTEDGDAGEGSDIADGEYITDETYKGDISADGSTLTVETALSHYDKDWNTVPDYVKRTYVFSTSKDCKCVIYQEEKEEYPVAEQVEFINDFLKGNSGLPISLTIKNNELVEIGFSS